MRSCNKSNYHYKVINKINGEMKLYMTIKEIAIEFNFTEQTIRNKIKNRNNSKKLRDYIMIAEYNPVYIKRPNIIENIEL